MPGNQVALIMGIEADSLGQFATSSQYFTGAFVSSIKENTSAVKISTYPNPANESVNFDLSALHDISMIEIFDKGKSCKNNSS